VTHPTPEEIAALLDLPASVRAELAKCEGPGWLWSRGGVVGRSWSGSTGWVDDVVPDHTTGFASFSDQQAAMLVDYLTRQERAWAWLPADTAEILSVARDRGAYCPTLYCAGRGYVAHAINVSDEMPPPCRTARLAALRLLAAVTR
jgi:hypothetical protein